VNSIEEIEERLLQENSTWAASTLQQLKQKSPLVLSLTLRLLRDAQRSQWGDCLAREFRVACRRLHDQDFLDTIVSSFKKENQDLEAKVKESKQ